MTNLQEKLVLYLAKILTWLAIRHSRMTQLSWFEQKCKQIYLVLDNGQMNRWGSWSAWSSCSTSCGGGSKSKTRNQICVESSFCPNNQEAKTASCNEQDCPGKQARLEKLQSLNLKLSYFVCSESNKIQSISTSRPRLYFNFQLMEVGVAGVNGPPARRLVAVELKEEQEAAIIRFPL